MKKLSIVAAMIAVFALCACNDTQVMDNLGTKSETVMDTVVDDDCPRDRDCRRDSLVCDGEGHRHGHGEGCHGDSLGCDRRDSLNCDGEGHGHGHGHHGDRPGNGGGEGNGECDRDSADCDGEGRGNGRGNGRGRN